MSSYALTDAQLERYRREGYLLIENYFRPEYMELLLKIARADRKLAAGAADRLDSEGRISRLSLRYELPDDIYGAFVRCSALVEPMEQLIGAEVYHYHHKMMLKEPRVGGAWEWHQDYGYWYSQFLFPAMASCMIAVDRARRENGCLQVLKGSHRMGRLEHGRTGDQTGADMERVRIALEHFERVHCEMEAGSALFFHSNLLHRSDPNTSPQPRWAFICCYSAVYNQPFRKEAAGQYSPLEKGEVERIEEVGLRHWEEVRGAPVV